MDNKIKKEVSVKIGTAKSVICFFFFPNATEQTFISGSNHELMAVIASQMTKSDLVRDIIKGAKFLYDQREAEKQ